MRLQGNRDDAARCLSVLLCLQRLRREAEAESGRLLRVLLVRISALSAGAAARQGIVLLTSRDIDQPRCASAAFDASACHCRRSSGSTLARFALDSRASTIG